MLRRRLRLAAPAGGALTICLAAGVGFGIVSLLEDPKTSPEIADVIVPPAEQAPSGQNDLVLASRDRAGGRPSSRERRASARKRRARIVRERRRRAARERRADAAGKRPFARESGSHARADLQAVPRPGRRARRHRGRATSCRPSPRRFLHRRRLGRRRLLRRRPSLRRHPPRSLRPVPIQASGLMTQADRATHACCERRSKSGSSPSS